jgi:hypothetical protein
MNKSQASRDEYDFPHSTSGLAETVLFDVPAYELTQPPSSRLTPWERRSSHVPLTAPGTVARTHVVEDKKGEPEISLPQHGNKENTPTGVSNVTLASTQLHQFLSLRFLSIVILIRKVGGFDF